MCELLTCVGKTSISVKSFGKCLELSQVRRSSIKHKVVNMTLCEIKRNMNEGAKKPALFCFIHEATVIQVTYRR